MSLKVLLIGNGGREHAIAWKLAQSPLVSICYVASGNGGTAGALGPKVQNVPISAGSFDQLVSFAKEHQVGLVIPGPEKPLVDGIKDYFLQHAPASIAVFGPSKACAMLEGSKAFAKEFMNRNSIPTARHMTFTDHVKAKSFLEEDQDTKWVLKADGLAGGKGVLIPTSHQEALAALDTILLDRTFGDAGNLVVIEEFLEGEELSVLSFSDGYTVKSLPAAQDHKRVFDGDLGENTGGMGCYAPTAVCTPSVQRRLENVIAKTVDCMRTVERAPFVGVLFTGFMVTKDGPKVLEYNVRMGDPETQTLLPLLETDLAEIMLACTSGYLSGIDLKIKEAYSSATVVIAAENYPGDYRKGDEMVVKEPAADTFHFHAGTSFDPKTQKLSTSGGRVIAATAIGATLQAAVEKAYKGVYCISFHNMHFRRDIAHRGLRRTLASDDVTPLTYAAAGVSIDNGERLVQLIKPFVKSTRRPGAASADIGGFAGLISLSEAGYGANSGSLVCCIDGIGSKLMIAVDLGVFDTVGIDLVAMNVNDLVVAGAEPLAFVDYYACSALEVEKAASFVKGVAEGCRQSNCVLLGGETAEMPGLYKSGDFDAAGTAIGILGSGIKPLPITDAMSEGNVLLALASNGVHSNGFSLVRKILERAGLKFSDPAPWESAGGRSVGISLLEPTKVYVKSLMAVLPHPSSQNATRVLGCAHITGGGIINNANRMLPGHLSANFDVSTWKVPSVLRWLKREGRMTNHEFASTFNCGLGMVMVVRKEDAEDVRAALEGEGETVWKVGTLKQKNEGEEAVVLNGLEAWDDL